MSTRRKRRTFTPEFKKQIVDLIVKFPWSVKSRFDNRNRNLSPIKI